MTSLFLAAVFFTAVHVGVSGTRLRDRLVAAIGLRGYMVAYSLVSVGGIAWLCAAYKTADYVPVWGQLQWWKAVVIVAMLPAFMLVVVGLTTPNPTAVAQEGLVGAAPRGVVRITRHPFLVGVGLWAFVHLVGNGDWASWLFFGALLVVCAAGTVSIDAKRRRAVGAAAWDGFAARTSIVPFGAIASGRNTLDLREIGWGRLAGGFAAYALMLGGHAHLVGVSPFPW